MHDKGKHRTIQFFQFFAGILGAPAVQQFATVGVRFGALLRSSVKFAKVRLSPLFMRVSCVLMLSSRKAVTVL